MSNEKMNLLYEYERLDIEYEILESIEERLWQIGKPFAADDVKESREYLFKSILCLKKACKYLDASPNHEQIKMDIAEVN